MHKRNLFLFRFLSLILCISCLFSALPAEAALTQLKSAPLRSGNTQNGMVRVRLSSLGNPSTLNLTVSGSYTVNGNTSKTLPSGSGVKVDFNKTTGALSMTVNGVTTQMGTAFKLRRHATSGENGIKIAQGRVPGNLYPGDFYFLSRSASSGYQLYVIAYIYMEDYLYGVLPYEMGNSSGLEALKAQAVSARTYTMRAMAAASSSLYDVVDTTSDQVYSGTPSGNANCKAAVDATKGIVAMNGSAFTATYYTASNGGQIESVKNAWGSNSYSYLKVKDDPYDLANPASRKQSFTVNKSGAQSNAALGNLLNSKAASRFGTGAQVTAVSAVTPHTPKYPSPSRLYTKLDFSVSYSLNGQSHTGVLTFDIFSELESALNMSINSGSNELWSVSETDSAFTVTSRRYGHGIGMSQRGAMYMAQLGYTYDQILAFYFEGCSRVQYTLTRSILSPVIPGQESQEEVIPEPPADLETAENGTAIVMLSSANAKTALKSAPSANAAALILLPNGASVKVYGASGDEILVGYGEICGYVNKAYLSISGDIPASTTMTPTRLAGYGTVTGTSSLNLRSAANMSSTVLTTIPKGEKLPLLEIGSEWSRTQYGLRVGYVSNDYLSFGASAPETEETAGNGYQVNTAAPFRLTANTQGHLIETLPAGTEVMLLSTDGTWSMIRYNKKTGYVLSGYLTALGRDAANTAEDTASGNERYATVTSSSTLNFRLSPSLDGFLMAELPTGTRLIVESQSGEWSTVRYHGVRGYVMSQYIRLESGVAPTQPPQGVETPGLYAQVTTQKGSLNMRSQPSDTAKVLCTIPQYTTISILEKGDTWCKTTYNGFTGYVMTKFLTFLGDPATPSPTPSPTPVPTPTAYHPGILLAQVVTASGSLNLRATATENGRILRTIPQYEIIQILERGATWCKTTYNGYTGFVMTRFLSFLEGGQPTAVPTQSPTLQPSLAPENGVLYAKVTTAQGSLNMRESPRSNAKVLRTIPQYTVIPIYEAGSLWCRTVYGGMNGYVMTSFLTFVSGPDTQQPTPNPTAVPTLAPTFPPLIAPTNAPDTGALYARVTTAQGSLNLRESARSNARVLCTIPQYSVIEVISKGASWCQVYYGGMRGYVMTQFLTFLSGPAPTYSPTQSPTSAPTQPPQGGIIGYAQVVTLSGSLNLREAARSDAKVLCTIPQYATIPLYTRGSAWCRVSYNGYTGYVMTKFLSFTGSNPAPTQAPSQNFDAMRDPTLVSLNTTVLGKVMPKEGTTLNLRAGCSLQATEVDRMNKQDFVIITAVGDTWCAVQYEGKNGFCLKEHLEFSIYE